MEKGGKLSSRKEKKGEGKYSGRCVRRNKSAEMSGMLFGEHDIN